MSLKLNGLRLAPVLWSALAGLAGCAPSQDIPSPSAGSFDASSYVAVGDGYGSGYAEGVLTRIGQRNSYPALLARQLRLAGAEAAFSQALLTEGSPAAYTDPRCSGPQTVPQFAPRATALSQDLTVPGLRLADTETVDYGNAARPTVFNPFFERLLPTPNASTTYLQAVTAVAPTTTFFTYFAGLDDILPYLRSGGTCGGLPTASTINTRAEHLLDQLTAGGRRGIIAQLPPLVQVKTVDGVIIKILTFPLLRPAEAVQQQFQTPADSALLYFTNSNPVFGVEPVNAGQFVLTKAVARIGRLTPVVVNGVTLQLPYGRDLRNPLVNADVLDADESRAAESLISDYNTSLRSLATTKYRLPTVERSDKNATTLNLSNAVFGKVAGGLSIAGVQYSAVPGSGGIFSSDLYSFTPRGNGLLANAFINALNVAYDANIPLVDINTLPTTAQ